MRISGHPGLVLRARKGITSAAGSVGDRPELGVMLLQALCQKRYSTGRSMILFSQEVATMFRPTRLIAFLSILVVFSFFFSASAAPLTATAPPLHTAWTFAVLGGSTVTNTGPSIVTGDLGVWSGTSITGFSLVDGGPGVVIGVIHQTDAVAQQAQSDVTTAYNDLAGQAVNTDLTGTDLGGLTLAPGVYHFNTSAQLTGVLTLDAQGDPDAIWVFQIGSTLTTASNSSVQIINGGQSCNVWWQVGSSATLGTNTAFTGYILALASITLNTGANLQGAALARTGAVAMDSNAINNSLKCFGPNAIAMQEFQASSAIDFPLGLGAGAALLLALGLLVIVRRVMAPADAMPSVSRDGCFVCI